MHPFCKCFKEASVGLESGRVDFRITAPEKL